MSLPAPNLDDRTFQDLVDETKNFVRGRCPEWSDHNVSDPGVTLIEAFAWMTDILLYRLNRVTDRHYAKFLQLIGVELFAPAAARALVSFRLSVHQPDPVRIARGTATSTKRTPGQAAIAFRTIVDATVVPAVSNLVVSVPVHGEPRDLSGLMGAGNALECFASHPAVGDALYVSLDQAAPAHIVLFQFQCAEARGHGIDPLHPPLRWEAWDGSDWAPCAVEVDLTRGLNVSGPIEIHLPPRHEPSYVAQREGYWMRCVVVTSGVDKAYRDSPVIHSVTAATVGVDITSHNAEEFTDEPLSPSTGLPGQSATLSHLPVLVRDADVVLQSRNGDGSWSDWQARDTFADSGPRDRHFRIDPSTGVVSFGPQVRLPAPVPDGATVRQFGAVPPAGAELRMHTYHCGGGSTANVAAREISVLRSSIPYVARVYNMDAAAGGLDGETPDEARIRGPLLLHARNRAVTLGDYETLTRAAAPELARVHAMVDSGSTVRIAVVPRAPEADGRIELIDLVPDEPTLARIESYLDERRTVGAVVVVSHAVHRAVTVVATVISLPGTDIRRVQRDALTALYSCLSSLSGGRSGTGWEFGRAVRTADIRAVLRSVPGVAEVEDPLLFVADLERQVRAPAGARIDLQPAELVYSYEHDITVVPG